MLEQRFLSTLICSILCSHKEFCQFLASKKLAKEGTKIPRYGILNLKWRRRQYQQLKNLPDDFEMRIKAHATMYNFTRENIEGELFEETVKADKDICPETEFVLSERILSLMKNPSRFGLDLFFTDAFKNPDILIIDKSGKIVKAIEAKNRIRISSTNMKQMLGFKDALNAAVNRLKRVKKSVLKGHGNELNMMTDFLVGRSDLKQDSTVS